MSVKVLVAALGVVCVLAGCGDGGEGDVLHIGNSTVLVGAKGDGDSVAGSGFGGTVAMVGHCLGLSEATVIWPYGTRVISDDPLTIDVPGLGTLAIGDQVGGGGVEYGDHLPEGIDAIPSGCPTNQVVAFHPDS